MTDELEKIHTFEDGHTLYRKENSAGGYTYLTDELGLGIVYADTCIHDMNIMSMILLHIDKNGLYPDKPIDTP